MPFSPERKRNWLQHLRKGMGGGLFLKLFKFLYLGTTNKLQTTMNVKVGNCCVFVKSVLMVLLRSGSHTM